VNPAKSTLSVNYKLVGATPNKLYQVGVHMFCTTFPPTFGQFPAWPTWWGGDSCALNTKQGVTETLVGLELGVVTTDINGRMV
jgi:hypothetical protein